MQVKPDRCDHQCEPELSISEENHLNRNVAVQAVVNIPDLECQSEYVVVAAAVDQAGNTAERLVFAHVSTPDVSWPVLVDGTPTLRAASHGSMWLEVALNEAGSVIVLVSTSCCLAAVLL